MPDGGSAEAHHRVVANARGIDLAEQVGQEKMPEWEDAMGYLLSIFSELSASRTMGYASANPISYSEVAAWQAVSGIRLDPIERKIIKAIDSAFCEVMNARCNKDNS